MKKFVKKVLKRVAYHPTKDKKHRLTVNKKERWPTTSKEKKTNKFFRMAGCSGLAGWLLWLGWLWLSVPSARRVRSPVTRPHKGPMSKPLAVRHAMAREQSPTGLQVVQCLA